MVVIFSSLLGTAYAAGDPVAGQLKAKSCEGCHGQDSNNPLAPRLAGQPENYTIQQLINFQSGMRKDPIMNGMAAALTNKQDIEDIAAYYASLPYLIADGNRLTAASSLGERLYKNKCIMCHGERGKGGGGSNMGMLLGGGESQDNLDIPLIGGQPKKYLVKSLHEFRSGSRKSDNSFVMDMVVQRMTSMQIKVVAKYLSSLSRDARKGNTLAKQD